MFLFYYLWSKIWSWINGIYESIFISFNWSLSRILHSISKYKRFFLKLKPFNLIIRIGPSVTVYSFNSFRHVRIVLLIFNFFTFHEISFNRYERFKKHSNSINVTRKSVCPLKTCRFFTFLKTIYIYIKNLFIQNGCQGKVYILPKRFYMIYL